MKFCEPKKSASESSTRQASASTVGPTPPCPPQAFDFKGFMRSLEDVFGWEHHGVAFEVVTEDLVGLDLEIPAPSDTNRAVSSLSQDNFDTPSKESSNDSAVSPCSSTVQHAFLPPSVFATTPSDRPDALIEPLASPTKPLFNPELLTFYEALLTDLPASPNSSPTIQEEPRDNLVSVVVAASEEDDKAPMTEYDYDPPESPVIVHEIPESPPIDNEEIGAENPLVPETVAESPSSLEEIVPESPPDPEIVAENLAGPPIVAESAPAQEELLDLQQEPCDDDKGDVVDAPISSFSSAPDIKGETEEETQKEAALPFSQTSLKDATAKHKSTLFKAGGALIKSVNKRTTSLIESSKDIQVANWKTPFKSPFKSKKKESRLLSSPSAPQKEPPLFMSPTGAVLLPAQSPTRSSPVKNAPKKKAAHTLLVDVAGNEKENDVLAENKHLELTVDGGVANKKKGLAQRTKKSKKHSTKKRSIKTSSRNAKLQSPSKTDG